MRNKKSTSAQYMRPFQTDRGNQKTLALIPKSVIHLGDKDAKSCSPERYASMDAQADYKTRDAEGLSTKFSDANLLRKEDEGQKESKPPLFHMSSQDNLFETFMSYLDKERKTTHESVEEQEKQIAKSPSFSASPPNSKRENLKARIAELELELDEAYKTIAHLQRDKATHSYSMRSSTLSSALGTREPTLSLAEASMRASAGLLHQQSEPHRLADGAASSEPRRTMMRDASSPVVSLPFIEVSLADYYKKEMRVIEERYEEDMKFQKDELEAYMMT